MSAQAVVIGSGPDALVAAHLLARAGRGVVLVHETPLPARDVGWVPSPVIKELGLQIRVDVPDPWASAVLPEG